MTSLNLKAFPAPPPDIYGIGTFLMKAFSKGRASRNILFEDNNCFFKQVDINYSEKISAYYVFIIKYFQERINHLSYMIQLPPHTMKHLLYFSTHWGKPHNVQGVE